MHDQRHIRVPKIRWVYTTPKVLTMDFVGGVKIDDIPALTAAGADRAQIAYDFTNSLITQILENGVFHADPHPGNVFVVDGKYVEFIDLGMVGTINSRFRRELNDFVLGIATRNTLKIAQSLSLIHIFLQGNPLHKPQCLSFFSSQQLLTGQRAAQTGLSRFTQPPHFSKYPQFEQSLPHLASIIIYTPLADDL